MNSLRFKKREIIYLSFVLIGVILLSTISPAFALTPRDRIRPLRGGIQIQNDGWWFYDDIGSIGLTAYDVEHMPGIGTLYHYGFVTASHLTSHGESVYQPTISDNNYVGSTTKDPPFPRYSDSAFIHTETRLNAPPTTISRYVFSCRSITNYDYVTGYRTRSQMYVGESVSKVGRTTDCTTGRITRFWDRFESGGIVIYDVVLADFQAEPGDSGGTVHQPGTPPKPDYPAPTILYGIVNARVLVDFWSWKWEIVFSPTDGILGDLQVYVYRG